MAFQQNYDVKIAATRILEAQAQLGITRADQFPTLSGDVAAGKQRMARSSFLPAFETSVLQVDLMLAWELDFWGQFRRATDSAQASLLASAWGQRAVISTSVSNVAMAYFQLRALDLELEISTHTLASRQASLRLNRFLVDHGATTLLDVRQAEQLVYTCAPLLDDHRSQLITPIAFCSMTGPAFSHLSLTGASVTWG
jgi:multidrug efflux system outer membrane protein